MYFRKENTSEMIAKEIGLEITPRADTEKVVDMFFAAFQKDPYFDYILASAKHPENVVKQNFHFDLEQARLNGVVLRTSAAYEGAAVWHFSGFPKSNLLINLRITWFKLNQFHINDIRKLLSFFLETEKAHIQFVKVPHYYLTLLGVHPDFQGQGWGSKLMKPVLEHADRTRKICYLETETEKNVEIYRYFGFKLMRTFKPSFSDANFHLMLRKPK